MKTIWESIIYLAYLENFIYQLLFINQMFIYLLCSLNVSRTRMMLINSCDRWFNRYPTGMSLGTTSYYIQAASVGCGNVKVGYKLARVQKTSSVLLCWKVVGVQRSTTLSMLRICQLEACSCWTLHISLSVSKLVSSHVVGWRKHSCRESISWGQKMEKTTNTIKRN